MRGNNKEPKHKLTQKDCDEGTFASMLHASYVRNDKSYKKCNGCKFIDTCLRQPTDNACKKYKKGKR